MPDPSAAAGTRRDTFAMARRFVVLLAVATAGFTTAAFRADAGPGRLLLSLAAVASLLMFLRGALLRPIVRLTASGVEVVEGARRRHYPWHDVTRLTTLPPAGRFAAAGRDALEIDLGSRLVVVPGIWLGADAADVVSAAQRVAPRPLPDEQRES